MPATKTTKRPAKTAKNTAAKETVKPAGKAAAKQSAQRPARTAKKVTVDDMWDLIAEIGQIQKETAASQAQLKKEIAESDVQLKKEIAESDVQLKKEIAESDAQLKKEIAEFDAQIKKELAEFHKETERMIRDANAETERTLNKAIESTEKTLNKAIGGLSNTMGALVEKIMTAGLPQKFKQFGFSFGRITTAKWADGENNIFTQIDGLLENGTQAMTVEVKTTLRQEDVDDHLLRMEKVRKYSDIHGDTREFFGAIAATIVDKSAKEYALKKGFFVIEPSGEDVKVTKPVSAKVW